MTEAVFGLVGVIVGGFLNTGTGLMLARREDRKRVRTLARLLLPELTAAGSQIDHALALGSWSSVRLPTERWDRHEAELARVLVGEWDVLSTAYAALSLFDKDREWREEAILAEKARGGSGETDHLHDLDPDDVEHLTDARTALNAALRVLEPLAGATPDYDLVNRSLGI